MFVAVCNFDNIEKMEFIWNKFKMTPSDVINGDQLFSTCVGNGHLKTAGFLRDKLSITKKQPNWLFLDACSCYNLETVKWLYTEFKMTREECTKDNNKAFRNACKGGKIDIAKWLYTELKLTRAECMILDNLAFRWSCVDSYSYEAKGDRDHPIAVAKWLFRELKLTKEECDEYYDMML